MKYQPLCVVVFAPAEHHLLPPLGSHLLVYITLYFIYMLVFTTNCIMFYFNVYYIVILIELCFCLLWISSKQGYIILIWVLVDYKEFNRCFLVKQSNNKWYAIPKSTKFQNANPTYCFPCSLKYNIHTKLEKYHILGDILSEALRITLLHWVKLLMSGKVKKVTPTFSFKYALFCTLPLGRGDNFLYPNPVLN